MSLWELVVAIATGAGTMASVLGIFYTWVSRQNHREMGELIERLDQGHREQAERHRELVERLDQGQRELLTRMDQTQRFLGELIVADGERTRQLLRQGLGELRHPSPSP